MNDGAMRLETALRNPKNDVAVAAYLTAGYPDSDTFTQTVTEVARVADVIEIGVPFSDPIADGLTIQEANLHALQTGVSLEWIFSFLSRNDIDVPVTLMTYFNPVLAYTLERVVSDAQSCGVAGFIVPDLPIEDADEFMKLCEPRGLALIQLITPETPKERMRTLCERSRGFVYAVSTRGITGGHTTTGRALRSYLSEAKALANLPILAGFGIRNAEQVAAIADIVDGVIVGSILIEELRSGRNPADLVESLTQRPGKSGVEIKR